MNISIPKIIREILSRGYSVFGRCNTDKLASILTNGYYPVVKCGGGGASASSGGWDDRIEREDREFRELMDVLIMSGALN